MSDDIDRLKKVLEQLRCANDTLKEDLDVTKDVVAAVKPVELETDPAGHAALCDIANDIFSEWQNLSFLTTKTYHEIHKLLRKARA